METSPITVTGTHRQVSDRKSYQFKRQGDKNSKCLLLWGKETAEWANTAIIQSLVLRWLQQTEADEQCRWKDKDAENQRRQKEKVTEKQNPEAKSNAYKRKRRRKNNANKKKEKRKNNINKKKTKLKYSNNCLTSICRKFAGNKS